MKYVIVILDGAADFPLSNLENKTPLEWADIPTLDFITKNGKTGLLQTSYHHLPVGSIVANLSILGYDPVLYHPHGRASFEALAKGIKLNKNDVAFRCNLISAPDDKITDFTAGMIKDEDASNIISKFQIKQKNIELHFGLSYRSTLIVRKAKFLPNHLLAFEPHMNIGKPISEVLIQAQDKKAEEAVQMLNQFILESRDQIKRLNQQFPTKADMFWLWSPSSTPSLPDFATKWGIKGAVVSGMDFLKGIGISAGMEAEHIPGTTGYIDTNIKSKVAKAKEYLTDHDLVMVHFNAPDEEAHQKNPHGKVKAIELGDREIVKELLEHLQQNYPNFRMAVMPDHYTLCKDGTHNNFHVPYVMYGTGIAPDVVEHFTEKEIEDQNQVILKGHEFLKVFLG